MTSNSNANDPAYAAMTLDMLSNVLRQADNPGKVGDYLTTEIRELTGARCVIFIESAGTKAAHRVLSVNPERRRAWAESPEAHRFYEVIHGQPETQIWRTTETAAAPAFLQADAFELSLSIPLRLGEIRVGTLALFGLPDERFLASEIALLNTLSTLVALVVRNALLYERQEQTIQERTAQLQASNQFNQQIIQSAQDGIIVYDRQLRYQVWNPFMEQLSGMTASEVLGKHPLELFPFLKEAGIIERLEKVLAGEVTSSVSFPFDVRQTGKTGWTSDTSAPLRNAQGEIIGVIGVVRDITESRLLEEKLRQSQKMESFGTLAGGVAHDFNNILAAIVMNTEMLLAEPPQEAESREALQQINEAAQRAANLTRQLLTFSRKQPIRRQHLDLNEVVDNLAKMLRRIIGEDITLQCRFSPEPLPVFADAGMLEQVLLNLAVNARDAMPQGGDLHISLALVEAQSAERPPAMREGEFVCLRVQDTGCGIAAQDLPRIFEPFFTTKEVGKGTGLGLATAYGIVQQHEGLLEVDSHLGKGTTFKVFLPVNRGEKHAPSTASSETSMPRGTEGILVVEDEAPVRTLLGNCLRRLGYQVMEAPNGQEALPLWAQNRDKIDLLLTDIIMPGGIPGQELAARLLREKKQLKVVYISGYSPDLAKNVNLRANLNYLPKPFTPAALAQTVRHCLDAL
jgi:PAS domain S-box-containing protein